MKKDIQFDKYGYGVKSSSRCKYNSELKVFIHYVSSFKKEKECFVLSVECKNSNLIKNIIQQKEIEKLMKSMTIIESIAYVISNKYGYMQNYAGEYDLIELIDKIPEDIIINNEAIKELLQNLPQDNKFILFFVANKIKGRRSYLEEQKKIKEAKKNEINKEYETVIQELNLN